MPQGSLAGACGSHTQPSVLQRGSTCQVSCNAADLHRRRLRRGGTPNALTPPAQDYLTAGLPSKRTLQSEQRSALAGTFGSATTPAALRQALEVAAELPSFGPASALRDLGDAALELLRVRVAHTLNGRSEEFRLRKAVEVLAVSPPLVLSGHAASLTPY